MRETKLGVTLHLLNDKFDQGDIVAQAAFEVAEAELNLARLQQDCAILGVELFIEATNNFADEGWEPIPQTCV
jgi:methionyl-tRNA formyltransferase